MGCIAHCNIAKGGIILLMIKRRHTARGTLAWVLQVGVISIFLYVPFHGFVSTVLTGAFGHPLIWKSAKDVFIGLLAIAATVLLINNPVARRAYLKSTLNLWIAAFAVLHLFLALVFRTNASAVAAALAINLRFLVIFTIVRILYSLDHAWLPKRRLLQILFVPFVLVTVFALLQRFVLPKDLLAHVGYGDDTIPAYFTVDNQSDIVRFASTLRGPNELGAYLITPTAIALAYMYKRRELKYALLAALGVGASFVAGSRSAWLGAVAAILLVVWHGTEHRVRKLALWTIGIVAAVSAVAVLALWNTSFVQSNLLHDSATTKNVTSNEMHWSYLHDGLIRVLSHPLGGGPGTAGPASRYYSGGASITEDYYLQIGQELGWLGLAIFLGILWIAGTWLWRCGRNSSLALGLAAALIGLSIASLLLHTWADEAVAVTWWLVCGVAFGLFGRGSERI